MLMEVTGPERGLQKLEALADDLDANPGGYDQKMFPTCALGRYGMEGYYREPGRFPYGPYDWAREEFGITLDEAFFLFNAKANTDPRSAAEAAARIRKFVYEKRRVALAA